MRSRSALLAGCLLASLSLSSGAPVRAQSWLRGADPVPTPLPAKTPGPEPATPEPPPPPEEPVELSLPELEERAQELRGRLVRTRILLGEGFTSRGPRCRLSGKRLDQGYLGIRLRVPRKLAVQWDDEYELLAPRRGWRGFVPAVVTARVTEVEEGELEGVTVQAFTVLGPGGEAQESFPRPSRMRLPLTMRQVNQAPRRYLGRRISFPGVLAGPVILLGKRRRLQVLKPGGGLPASLEFWTSQELAAAWSREGPRHGKRSVLLSGTLHLGLGFERYRFQVDGIEWGPAGRGTWKRLGREPPRGS